MMVGDEGDGSMMFSNEWRMARCWRVAQTAHRTPGAPHFSPHDSRQQPRMCTRRDGELLNQLL